MRTYHLLALSVVLLLTAPWVLAEDEEPRPPGGQRGGGMWDRLKASDADGDGKVSRDEFRGPDRQFDRLDADGDGFVTEEEAARMQSRRGGRQDGGRGAPAASGGAAGITLELVDANRDGVVTLGEWTEFFATADCDGDGELSAEEWKQMLSPPTRPGGNAPAVGSAAPTVEAVPLEGGEAVDLSAPKRTTVLVFGSWT